MHKKFTKYVRTVIYLLMFTLVSGNLIAQKWSGVNGNEWLDGKYAQTWIKIGVSQNGVHKVSLPTLFQNKATQLHLYHRGVEVALLSATATEIQFYGVVNDGASDALLYRPYTGVRSNPYYSRYSDQSAYFLTFSSATGAKMAENQSVIPTSGVAELYHLQEEIKLYTEADTYDGTQNLVIHSLDQSYLIEGKGRSSGVYFKRTGSSPSGNPVFSYPFQLKNLSRDPARSPIIEVLLNGRTFSNNIVRASIGQTSVTLRNYDQLMEFSNFVPFKSQYNVNNSLDIDAAGQGNFQLESIQITDQSASTGAYSVTYVKLIYPQLFDMSGVSSKVFNLLPSTSSSTNVSIANAPANATIYDITNPDAPRIIAGTYSGTTLNLMVQRIADRSLNLLITNEVVLNTNITSSESTTFTKYDPASVDYLIITNETLYGVASDYANYRKSLAGGSYNAVTFKIKDIYNQFNYGEPSPVAIRRFVDYMVNRSPRTRHNVLLIGPSTTLSAKLLLNRELPEEVPTIGFPGSDVLLVEGLSEGTADIPTVPVGRISATTVDQVNNYLDKVKTYESQLQQTTRKKVMHLNGGLYAGESETFAGYLADYSSLVTATSFSGSVTAKVKGSSDFGYPSSALNISADVNSGFGMMTYFGHGSSHYTDNNIGYATDPARAYSNDSNYPIMYFNGCGVGNIFNGAFSPFPTTPVADQIPLSSDWLLASKKGAVAIVANSYYAFETSSKNYLGKLYSGIFKSDAQRQTLGLIHKSAAKLIIDDGASDYDIANNHQSLLFGDPALKVLTLSSPLPVELVSFTGKLLGKERVQLEWKTSWEKMNSHFLIERSYNARDYEVIGLVEGKGDTNSESSYQFIDDSPYSGNNYYRLAQVDKSTNLNGSDTNYSRVISVFVEGNGLVVIQPNPAIDKFSIKLQANTAIKTWNLIDINGRYIKTTGVGNEVNIESLPTGEYIIELLTVNGDIYRRKVVKR